MAIEYRHLPSMEILSCTDPFEFKPHIHDRYVVWINTGCGEHFSIKGNTDILQPGSISIIEPGLVHANHPCSETRRHLRSFYIDPDFFNDHSEGDREKTGFGYERKTIKDKALWRKMACLHQQIISGTDISMLESNVIDTFMSLVTRHGKNACKTSNHDTCDIRVRKAVEYFRAHLDQEVLLKDLAEKLGCTQYHLIRLFKAHKGMSPHAFLRQMRLEHARRRLEQGCRISHAAHEAGFSDQSHLTRAFKSRFGLTPSVYQAAVS